MIWIDLKVALTDAVIAEALPNMNVCDYTSPCIIGAMVPLEQREEIEAFRIPSKEDNDTSCNVRTLAQYGIVSFTTEEQREQAFRLQRAFDAGERGLFNEIVNEIRNAA